MKLILSEIHGSKQNVDYIQSFVDKKMIDPQYNKKILIGFEWKLSLKAQNTLKGFIENTLNDPSDFLDEIRNDGSGKFSKQHFNLLLNFRAKNFKKNRIKVFTFDNNADEWNVRDMNMKENIISNSATEEPETDIVICTGALHGRTEKFIIDKKVFEPLGFLLKNYNFESTFLRPSSGKVYNFGEINVANLSSLGHENEIFYDSVIDLGVVSPVDLYE